MNKRSVIFFDIDGTLLTHEKELPPLTKESIYKLKQQGHEVVISTGRAPFMFEELRRELDVHTFISYNGQYVVLNDEVLYTNPLKKQSLEKLTEAALSNNYPVVFMDHLDMKANVPEHEYIKESMNTLKIDRFPAFDPDYGKSRELYQTLLFCPEGKEKQYEQEFQDFDFVRWHQVSVDILPKGGSKAKGIEKIVHELGIPRERHYAFGDGLNDIEMLKAVKNSVAMGNAVDRVKKAAKHVTKRVEENGIFHGLKMLGLL